MDDEKFRKVLELFKNPYLKSIDVSHCQFKKPKAYVESVEEHSDDPKIEEFFQAYRQENTGPFFDNRKEQFEEFISNSRNLKIIYLNHRDQLVIKNSDIKVRDLSKVPPKMVYHHSTHRDKFGS